MPKTPDRAPGGSLEEFTRYDGSVPDSPQAGDVYYNGGTADFQIIDGDGTYDPRETCGEAAHEALDTLAHELAETGYEEITRTAGQVSAVVVWQTASKLKKVRETLITRSGGQASTIVVKQYDGDGVLKTTLTGTINRTGGRVADIAWVRS